MRSGASIGSCVTTEMVGWQPLLVYLNVYRNLTFCKICLVEVPQSNKSQGYFFKTKEIVMDPVKDVNIIVAAGSVDGMAGAAAFIRYAKNPNIHLVFTQAFQVDTVNISSWPAASKVGFIDLGVNNEGRSPNPQLTVSFVESIYNNGHTILFIADEHGKNAWEGVLKQCKHSVDELFIQPEDRGEEYGSSCAILWKSFGDSIDDHTKALLDAGNQADQMNFNTPFGEILNNSIKSDMFDIQRRPYVVRHLANSDSPDQKIQLWMDEYATIEFNKQKILETRFDLGEISSYDCTIGPHDATAIFNEAYKTSSVVALIKTPIFVEGQKQFGVSIATNRKDLNVLDIVQKAGITAGGMAQKANIAFVDRERAIKAIQDVLQSRVSASNNI